MAGTEHKWRAEHASAVEKALAGAPASLATVIAAVKAVRSDVRPGQMADADFLMSAAEGLLFEALVSTLGLVSPALHCEVIALKCTTQLLQKAIGIWLPVSCNMPVNGLNFEYIIMLSHMFQEGAENSTELPECCQMTSWTCTCCIIGEIIA